MMLCIAMYASFLVNGNYTTTEHTECRYENQATIAAEVRQCNAKRDATVCEVILSKDRKVTRIEHKR